MKNKIKGRLVGFSETGTEGTYPALQDVRFPNSYEGLKILRDGSKLEIYKGPRKVWSDTLELLHFDGSKAMKKIRLTSNGISAGYQPYPLNPKYGQFEIEGHWVHSLPINMDLTLYFTLFFTANNHMGVLTLD